MATITSALARAAAQARIEDIKRKLQEQRNQQAIFDSTQGGNVLANTMDLLPQVAQSLLKTGVSLADKREEAEKKAIEKRIAIGDYQGLESLLPSVGDPSNPEGVPVEEEEKTNWFEDMFSTSNHVPSVSSADVAKAKLVNQSIALQNQKEQAELAKTGAETKKIGAEEVKAMAEGQKALADANQKIVEAKQLVGPQNVPPKPISELTPQEVQDLIIGWKTSGFSGDVIQKTIDALYESDLKRADLLKDGAQVEAAKSGILLQKAQTAKTYADIQRDKERVAIEKDKATRTASGVDIKPIERMDRETLTARLSAAEKAKKLIDLMKKADAPTLFNEWSAWTQALKSTLKNPAFDIGTGMDKSINNVRNDRAKEIIREAKQLVQMVGKAREGGKLTDSDLKFYLENLLNIESDSSGDFMNSLYTLANDAVVDYNRQRNTLLTSGATALDEFPSMETVSFTPSYTKEEQRKKEVYDLSGQAIQKLEPGNAKELMAKIDDAEDDPEIRLKAYEALGRAQAKGQGVAAIRLIVRGDIDKLIESF